MANRANAFECDENKLRKRFADVTNRYCNSKFKVSKKV